MEKKFKNRAPFIGELVGVMGEWEAKFFAKSALKKLID
jgi:hypothetical protein